ncbi:MAG TPA: GMC family oxidoreductase [Allosphingosinicella sp.]|nr:GMC family oxidoreductase [Allosphingosinicella sp.]
MTNGAEEGGTRYDAVVVGSGISGAVIARQLGRAGLKVLILEAGEDALESNEEAVDIYHRATLRIPSALFAPAFEDSEGRLSDPAQAFAPRPVISCLAEGTWRDPERSYYVQSGRLPFASCYERVKGGTARSWMGISLRMLPSDFTMRQTYGRLVDWPIRYDDLSPWYDLAEQTIGVSADVGQQSYHGLRFSEGYRYPMPPLPASFADGVIADGLRGLEIEGRRVTVTRTPSAQASQPWFDRNPCRGSTSCIPICPSRSRYDPLRTLEEALATGAVSLWTRTVASRLALDEAGHVAAVHYHQYAAGDGQPVRRGEVRARYVIVAANAVETARLLLLSRGDGNPDEGVANSSGLVGRNLMDHPMFVTWGLMPKRIYPYRGPLATSGIETFRDGPFRRERAAFRIEMGNVGWNFPMGDPDTTTVDFVTGSNVTGLNPERMALSGEALAAKLRDVLTRQFHFSLELEQAPNSENRVTLARATDRFGLPRPEIRYDFCTYTRAGFGAAVAVADRIFEHLGARQFTRHAESCPTSTSVPLPDGGSRTIRYFGAGHIAGTCRMGDGPATSVVDGLQRSWDHPNLFLVGSSTFPTIATANPTLTIVALCLRTADAIVRMDRSKRLEVRSSAPIEDSGGVAERPAQILAGHSLVGRAQGSGE